MEADDTVDPRFAELRSKYDETTRLLSAQCDTIERLQAQIRTLERQPGTNGGDAKPDEGECVAESCAEVTDESTAGFENKYRRAKRLVRMQAVEVATLRERVQRRETAEASLRSRVADAEEALRVTRVSADTLGVDYAAALETAERERAEALQARDEARAAAAAGDSELTRARTMLLVAEATARDAAAQRREDQASLDELNARVCAYETRVSEMQASHSASLEATHDAQIEADVVNARLESAERRAAEAESRLAEAAAARAEEREELAKELAASRAAATAAHTVAQRATVATEELLPLQGRVRTLVRTISRVTR